MINHLPQIKNTGGHKMAKTITEQIDDLQKENNHLKELEKLFDKAVKLEFNKDIKQLHKQLNKSSNHYQSGGKIMVTKNTLFGSKLNTIKLYLILYLV